MKGKRLPQIGRVEISIIEESNPQLLAFDSRELDYANVPADLVPKVLDAGNRLKPAYAQQGIRLARAMQPALSYCYFNMDDPVVGGYTPERIALRRAIVMGLNTPDLINVWYQGQAVQATQPIPPVVAGHSADFNVGVKYDPATARQLLDRFGYKDRDGDGWRDLPDGAPLILHMGSSTSGRDRERDELWKKSMTAIGIRIEFIKQKWPDLLKMGRAAQAADVAGGLDHDLRRGRRVHAASLQRQHRAVELRALRERRVRRSLPAVEAHSRRPGAQCDLPPDGRHHRGVQPVGSRRLPHREHAGAAVGAGLHQARLRRAPLAVPRPRPRAAQTRSDAARRFVARARQTGVRPARKARRRIVAVAAGA